MKKILFLTISMVGSVFTLFGQQHQQSESVSLNSILDFSSIKQHGSDNKVVFLHAKDPDLNVSSFGNLDVWQLGVNNTLILSELKSEVQLDIKQEGMSNLLLVENVGVPLQIRQTGGMELIIRGTNFLHRIE